MTSHGGVLSVTLMVTSAMMIRGVARPPAHSAHETIFFVQARFVPGPATKWSCTKNKRFKCSQRMPVKGRYHDAHVICDDGNATGMNCRGFLQAVYTTDGAVPQRVSFWEPWALATSPPHQRFDNASGAGLEKFLT